MTDAPPPPIGAIELPDPRGPVNDDFKRGACYAARIVGKEQKNDPRGTIMISIPGGAFECPR